MGRFTRDDIYQRHERGEISDAEFFAALRTSLGINLSDAQFLEGWNAIFTGEIPGIAPLLERAAKRLPPCINLKNYPARVEAGEVMVELG